MANLSSTEVLFYKCCCIIVINALCRCCCKNDILLTGLLKFRQNASCFLCGNTRSTDQHERTTSKVSVWTPVWGSRSRKYCIYNLFLCKNIVSTILCKVIPSEHEHCCQISLHVVFLPCNKLVQHWFQWPRFLCTVWPMCCYSTVTKKKTKTVVYNWQTQPHTLWSLWALTREGAFTVENYH